MNFKVPTTSGNIISRQKKVGEASPAIQKLFHPHLPILCLPLQQWGSSGQQCQCRGRVSKPGADIAARQRQGHPVVDGADQGVERGGQDDEPILYIYIVVDAGQPEQAVGQGEGVRPTGGVSFIKGCGRHHTAAGSDAAPEQALLGDRLRPGVDNEPAVWTRQAPGL